MDDDSKQILLLKIGVAFLVFLAILIFIVIIISVKNSNKKQSGLETTTRRTLSGEVTEDITTTSWFSEETTLSSETTTTTTSTTTVAPTTTTTTKKKSGGSGSGTNTTKKATGGGSSSSSGGGQSEIPSASYTVIGSNDATSYHNADNSMEWGLFNKINSATNNKYKMALELRTAAERIAQTCCEAPGSCNAAAKQLVDSEYQLTFRAFLDETGTYNTNYFYNNLANEKLLTGNYKYIGIGAIKATNQISCVAWIVDGD